MQKQCEITQFRCTLKTPQNPMHNHAFSVISQYTTKTVKNHSFSVHSRNTAKTYAKSHIFSDLSNTAKHLQHHTISMLSHSHWTSQTNATSRPQKQSQEKVCRRGRPRPLSPPKGGILICIHIVATWQDFYTSLVFSMHGRGIQGHAGVTVFGIAVCVRVCVMKLIS